MSRDDFEKLSDQDKANLVKDAMCYLIVNEDYFPLNVLDNKEEVSIIKIVLGKYVNEEIKLK